MIAVTFALAAESGGLIRQLQNSRRNSAAHLSFVQGTISDREVIVLHTGVGAEIARKRMASFLAAAQPRLVVSSGFAGAARDDLQPGDLILARNFSDPQLLAAADGILKQHGARSVNLASSNAVIDAAAERMAVAEKQNADAIDMETAAIAEACRSQNVALLSLRGISDTPRRPFPAPPSVLFDLERQRTSPLVLALYLLGHPSAIVRLGGFARQIGLTRQRLTNALVDLLREI